MKTDKDRNSKLAEKLNHPKMFYKKTILNANKMNTIFMQL